MATHVALLRAINVGGNNLVPMKALAELFAAAGATEVRTYIASGNVVYAAKDALARRIPELMSAAITKRFGVKVPVVTRTAAEMLAVSRSNPYLHAGADENKVFVGFLADAPGKAQIAALDPKRSPPDEYIVQGREIYLCFPNGAGKTKLSVQYFDSKLGTVCTMRNWRTVLKLVEMSGD